MSRTNSAPHVQAVLQLHTTGAPVHRQVAAHVAAALETSTIQPSSKMKLSKKEIRKRKKINRIRTNKALGHTSQKPQLGTTNSAVATGIHKKKLKTFTGMSGAAGRTGGTLFGYKEENMPWAGLQQAENYPFINCAEAQIYLKILAAHADPANFTLTTYTNGKINPPCGNCRQWVYGVFKKVVG